MYVQSLLSGGVSEKVGNLPSKEASDFAPNPAIPYIYTYYWVLESNRFSAELNFSVVFFQK